MLKNAYFFGNHCQNRLSVVGSAPEPPLASGGWGLRPRLPRCHSRLLLQLYRDRF